MTFWTIPTIICFAILSATVFMVTVEFYKMLSPDWVHKKALQRAVENLIAQETDTIQSKTAYPSAKTSAMNRLNVLVMIKELIDTL